MVNQKNYSNKKLTQWSFNKKVAQNFDKIAEKNIPRYQAVIDKCLLITKKTFPGDLNIKIIDIGSATGRTLDIFIKSGFKNVYGVENSKHMINMSKHKERVIFSDNFPRDMSDYFDVVTANWTLHFIKRRKQYIKDIYSSLKKGGFFVLTEKISTSSFIHNRYHDFKRKQGLTEKEILDKEISLKGVLTTKPLSWYLNTLKEVGFSEVEIIDTDWCFVSILCRK
ncbi:methyltransferase domain-containing protein [Candidatus Gracilibacteria bacterium]|nr:methyltransferase domain-containing protein [Candidatus Gracilibacteria bacterium]MCF7898483.1 methyltransferase domain-containing protein [Candidatus Paceibacterota bacterium]